MTDAEFEQTKRELTVRGWQLKNEDEASATFVHEDLQGRGRQTRTLYRL
jgi:hypothetical protein